MLLVLPLLTNEYTNQNLARIGVFAVAVLGLNVVMGYTGQVSLGQIFFVGVGAYVTAYGAGHGWNIVLVLLASVVVPGLVGLLVALAAARLGGLAIAMVTIALPIVGVPLAKRLSGLTGGSQGISSSFSNAPDWTGPVQRPVAALPRDRGGRADLLADPEPGARQVRARVRDREEQRGGRCVDGHLAVPLQGAGVHRRLPGRWE